MALLNCLLTLPLFFVLATWSGSALPAELPTPEYRLKAVFLYHFTQFVDWPARAFPSPEAPLVIGVLGEDPFHGSLETVALGETAHQHPLTVRYYRSVEDVGLCHILFISRSEEYRYEEILSQLRGRHILTVGDVAGFALRGGMIRFLIEDNKVRMKVNIDAVKDEQLVVSSKLLRPARIVRRGED